MKHQVMADAEPEHADRVQMIRSFVGHEDNLRIWGKIYVSQTGRTAGGWLLHSWSENGKPYWHAEQHWFEKCENKFYRAYFDIDRRSWNLHCEDKDIDPKRAAFIRKMVDKWELEWLLEQDASTRQS